MKQVKMQERSAQEQVRVMRGYSILAHRSTPKELGGGAYSVPSQNDENKAYTVKKVSGKWKCSCPDFKERKQECKHVHALKFWLELKRKVEKDSLTVITKEAIVCSHCKSIDIVKFGNRVCKDNIKQRFRCNGCYKTFIAERDFQRYKGNGKIITVILDLYFKGISLRGISDHLKQFYDLRLDHSNILRRIQKFSKIIDNYVTTLKPEVSDIWNHDEMKIQAGGKWKWLWNIMDKETKFLITTKVSTKLTTRVTKQFMNQAKEQADKQPAFLLTDGRHPLTKSIEKIMPETMHIRLATLTDKRANNQNIERLNGTVRDRIKTMRGFDNPQSAENMTSAFRNYYNFIKPHSSLDGITPAQKAGIGIETKGNRWNSLLTKALKDSKPTR